MTTFEERNRLIEENMNFADILAYKQFIKTPPCVQLDELKSAAYMGLVDAADKHDGEKPFRPYASFRILGEMKDYLRKLHWGGRNKRIKVSHGEFDEPAKEYSSLEDTLEDICSSLKDNIAKKIVKLYHLNNFTFAEIGEQVNLSTTRVYQIYQSSLRVIRETAA